MLRFDADSAKIWLNLTSFGAAIEWLLRPNHRESYRDKVAEVTLRHVRAPGNRSCKVMGGAIRYDIETNRGRT